MDTVDTSDKSYLQQQEFLMLGPAYHRPTVRWLAKKCAKDNWEINFVSTQLDLTEGWTKFTPYANKSRRYTWKQLVDLTHPISLVPESILNELFVDTI